MSDQNLEPRLVKCETVLENLVPTLIQKVDDMHKIICGNGHMGMDEKQRNMDAQLQAHLEEHKTQEGERSTWRQFIRNRFVVSIASILVFIGGNALWQIIQGAIQ